MSAIDTTRAWTLTRMAAHAATATEDYGMLQARLQDAAALLEPEHPTLDQTDTTAIGYGRTTSDYIQAATAEIDSYPNHAANQPGILQARAILTAAQP